MKRRRCGRVMVFHCRRASLRPPEYFITSLQVSPDIETLEELQESIECANDAWILDFIDRFGFTNLMDLLHAYCRKSKKTDDEMVACAQCP